MRKKLELLLDKHYENYRFSDPLHGETKEYVLDAMEEALTLYGVDATLICECIPTGGLETKTITACSNCTKEVKTFRTN